MTRIGAAFALLIALMSVSILSAGAEQEGQESTSARVLRTGVIRCAYANNPPVFIKDPNTGALSGIFYDVMNEVGKRLKVKIEWVEEVGYGVIEEGLAADRYDAFCATVWPTPERSRGAAFTIPLYYSAVDLFVRSDDHRFDADTAKLNDPGITFSVRDGDISQTFTNAAFPAAHQISVPELSDILQPLDDVVHHKADATISDPALLLRYARANPGKLIDLAATRPLRVSPNTIMIKPNQYQFKVMLDVTLTDLLNSGFIKRTLAKYPDFPVLHVADPYQATAGVHP